MNKAALATLILILAVLACAEMVWADPVFLFYYNSVGLRDEDLALLEDGCIIQLIYAGADGQIDIPSVYNGGTTGDDVIWQTTSIDDGAGGFSSLFVYDDSYSGEFVYVRFFNAPSWPNVTYYGQTPLHALSDFLGFETWDITDGGLFLYTAYPFMIIPEPETWATLISGLAFAALFFRKKKKNEPEDKLAA